jgi:putative transposase
VSAPVRRRQVAYATTRGVSVRRACALFQVARSSRAYTSRLAIKDAPALARMRELAAQFPRYGYRFILVFLARDGFRMGADRAYRLWRHAGLQVPRKRRRRRAAGSRPRPLPPTAANHVWAYDFVFDACANKQVLKCLTIVDEWTRECHAIDVAGSIRSARVIEVLARLVSLHGAPRYLRSDNGPEFLSRAIVRWLLASGIDTALIDPGKPWQNGTNESFNGTFRDECLNVEWFRTRTEATVVIEQWRRHYNEVRPHSSLAYQTPEAFKTTEQSKSVQRLESPSNSRAVLQ